MATYDPAKEKVVWQRVRGTQTESRVPPDRGNLQALIMGEWTDAAVYLQLSRKFQGQAAATLQRLFREERTHASCLKGIYTLITGEHPIVPTPPTPSEPVEITLRKCYAREIRCLSEYEARCDDPEYGPVFRRLAAQEQEHCRAILELIGSIQKK